MKFTRESASATTIRYVEKGRIVVGAETVTEDLLLFRDSIELGWNSDDKPELSVDSVRALLDRRPEIIIYGFGWETMLPPRDVVFELARHGVGFEAMTTPAACRTYNILLSEDRDVAAILRLT